MTMSEHTRALELAREMFNAEAAFNNPDMVYPDADIDPNTEFPELARWVAAAEQAFHEHLLAHRAVLEPMSRWAWHYELLDAPDEEEFPW